MSTLLRVALLGTLGTAGACGHRPPVASRPDCAADWTPAWEGDSTLALCVPPGFQRLKDYAWGRQAPGGWARDFVSVELLQWPEDSASLHSWPPHLASPPTCRADCGTVDSLSVHADQVAGSEARTEVGLVSGGMPGFRRQPMFRMGWVVGAGRRGFAQGWAENAATLDTMRMAVRTLTIAP